MHDLQTKWNAVHISIIKTKLNCLDLRYLIDTVLKPLTEFIREIEKYYTVKSFFFNSAYCLSCYFISSRFDITLTSNICKMFPCFFSALFRYTLLAIKILLKNLIWFENILLIFINTYLVNISVLLQCHIKNSKNDDNVFFSFSGNSEFCNCSFFISECILNSVIYSLSLVNPTWVV